MKKAMSFALALILLLGLCSSAFAEDNSKDEESEALSFTISASGDVTEETVIEHELYSMTITRIEISDKKGVNAYYDKYRPGLSSSFNGVDLVFLVTIESKSDETIYSFRIDEASVNEWMIKAYDGVSELAPGKKVKGFLYFQLEDCEAKKLADIDSLEFIIRPIDQKFQPLCRTLVTIKPDEEGWILTCEELEKFAR